jgi:adhesin transport system outer membrane protein
MSSAHSGEFMKPVHKLACLVTLACLQIASAGAAPPDALRDAARKAVVGNPEVQARWHAFRAADAEQDAARGGYFPQVDVIASVGRENQFREGLGTDRYTHRHATLSLNQMVYDGFFTRSQVARLGYVRLVRYYELLDAAESAALEAVRAYGDVLRYRELVQLAKENYVQHKQIHDQIAERARAGVGRRVDVEQASGRLALAESNLLTEVSNLHDVSARYLRLIGEVPADSLPPIGERLAEAPLPPTARDALREALAVSPVLTAAVENVRAAQADVDNRRAAYHPRLDFRARQALDHNLDGFDGRSRDSVVELVLSYNLFRGNSDRSRVRQAAEAHNVAKDLREKSCRDLRQTLSIAYNDSARLLEQLRYLDQHQLAIAKAREAYRRQFDIGQRTLLDLLDTENEYFEARRAYVRAAYDQLIAQGRTLAGMGRLTAALDVSRADLPTPAEAGQDRAEIDPDTVCPPDAPAMQQIDKDALLTQVMKEMGGAPVPAAPAAPAAIPRP